MGRGRGTLILFALATLCCVLGLQTPGCDGTRETVLACIRQLFDLDHDGVITPVEAAVALGGQTFSDVPPGLTWQFVMRCDMDEDDVLTMDDWMQAAPNATCLPTQNCLDIACDICARNGFVQPTRQAPQQQQQQPPQNGPFSPDNAEATRALIKKLVDEQAATRAAFKKARAETLAKKAPA